MKRAVLNWSGGKDSSLALYHALENKEFKIQHLLTTVNDKYDRISMHGVRSELLKAQTQSIGISLIEIRLPEMPSMDTYDRIMRKYTEEIRKDDITLSIFGDIFLEDLKEYRDSKLKEVGMTGHYPLWKRDTTELIHEFIGLGFKAVIVCTKSSVLSKEWVGREIDKDFIKDLPKNVDPCGENGEYHSFVYDGPIFRSPVSFKLGKKIYRTYNQPKDHNDRCNNIKESPSDMGFHYIDLTS